MKKNILKFTLVAAFLLIVAIPFISFAQNADVNDESAVQYSDQPSVNNSSSSTPTSAPASSSGGGITLGSTQSTIQLQSCSGSGIYKLICQFTQILTAIVPLMLALGVVYFVWGVVTYVIADDEEAKKTGKDRIIYGIIGFAVIVGLWGLVNIVVNTFGLGGASAPDLTGLVAKGGSGSCQEIGPNSKLGGVLDYFTCLISSSVIPFIFAIAMVAFVWGAVKFFIIESDEEAKREQGKQFMIWGIVALAVMVSVWGLVNIVGSTFGIKSSFLPQVEHKGSK